MSTLHKLEDLVGNEYLVKSVENLDFCKPDENNIRQADNNRIVDLLIQEVMQGGSSMQQM